MGQQNDTIFRPVVAVDTLIFTISNGELKLLLVKRGIEPYKDSWAIPGGAVAEHESLDDAAKRELAEETGVKNVYLEQLYSFGEPGRDPRGRTISIAYFALIPASKMGKLEAKTDVVEAKWYPVNSLPQLAFDHKEIVDYAIRRVKWKLEYTNVVFSLLPEEFTLTDLQEIYEIVFGRKFDKRNFRKKISKLNLLKPTGKMVVRGVHRPAKTYTFVKRKVSIVEIT